MVGVKTDLVEHRNKQLAELGLPYEILGQLKRGSTARCIYQGIEKPTKQLVAIKEYEKGKIFDSEIEALSKLKKHPTVVGYKTPIYLDKGATLMIVMEWCDGLYLYEQLTSAQIARGLTFQEKRKVVEQILDAVGYTHKKGTIHRDLKPDNIFASNALGITVLDFGHAKPKGALLSTTIGAREYRAPECHTRDDAGEQNDACERLDIYPLGIIAHEILAGDFATPEKSLSSKLIEFGGSDKADACARLQGFVTPEHFPTDSPRDSLARIVRRAIAPKAEDSYASAETMRLDFDLAFRAQAVADLEKRLREPIKEPQQLAEVFDTYAGLWEDNSKDYLPDSALLKGANGLFKERLKQLEERLKGQVNEVDKVYGEEKRKKLAEITPWGDAFRANGSQYWDKFAEYEPQPEVKTTQDTTERKPKIEVVEAPRKIVVQESSSSDTQQMVRVALEHVILGEYQLKVSFPNKDGAVSLEIPEINGGVSSLCYHNGLLYHGVCDEPAGVWETVAGKKVTKEHAKDGHKARSVWCLVPFNGALYHGISYKNSSGAVLETLTGTVIGKRPTTVRNLFDHNGVLYDAGTDVFETFTGKRVYTSHNPEDRCDAIISYDGKLCAVNISNDGRGGRCTVFDAISGEKFAEVNEQTTGRLKELYDTLVRHLKRNEVLVPISFAESLVKDLKVIRRNA